MRATLLLVIFSLLTASLLSCTRSEDAYTTEVLRLSEESQHFRPAFAEFEKKVEALPSDPKKERYQTPVAADEALALYNQYPSEPEPTLKIYSMIREGLPPTANPRKIIQARYKAFGPRLTLQLSLLRQLYKSSEVYKWPQAKLRALGKVIVRRALDHTDKPATRLETTIDMVQVKDLLEKKILKAPPGSAERLKDLLSESRQGTRKWYDEMNQRAPLVEYALENHLEGYLPQFMLRRWSEVNSEEMRSDVEIGRKLKPLLYEILEEN